MANIDPKKVIQYTDETGYSTYTFKIISKDENYINFENLHLLEIELGYIGYILNYEPDENWYESHLIYQHGEYILDMNDYVGNITKYSLERDIIWSTDQNIVPPSTTSRGGQFIEECTVSVEMICTYDIHGPGNFYRCEALEMVEVVSLFGLVAVAEP